MENVESRYREAIDFLFNSFPAFHDKGAGAYKPGLERTRALAGEFGNPHRGLDVIHVGGTNGKGSTSHTLAAVLQSAGYRTGLFTSPHLVDFRERIRIDGRMISREEVIDFVDRFRRSDFQEGPSFFELTTIMAFDHFARNGVDIAVVEVGLGGRLDSTNIVTPRLSVITNISRDHTMFLGDTPEQIASEKAGIIKPGVPVVVGRASGGVRAVFERKAVECGSPILFAFERLTGVSAARSGDGWLYSDTPFGEIFGELSGDCQPENARTVMASVELLRNQGLDIGDDAVARGFASVAGMTGLMGRWMTVGSSPRIICDTGHNEDGWRFIASRLHEIPGRKRIVVGFVSDKDVAAILNLMSEIGNSTFYLTRPSVERAMPVGELAEKCRQAGIEGRLFATVGEAVKAALADCGDDDTVFVGGSTFVVADFLSYSDKMY